MGVRPVRERWSKLLQNLKSFLWWQYKELLAAVRFLSVIPMPGEKYMFADARDEPDVVIGCEYFPVVGLVLALLLWVLLLLLSHVAAQLLIAAILVVALTMLTGGLHLDGLMDSCDGLLGGRTRERRLEIMRDSHVGSFGVLGGVCTLILKFALFASFSIHLLPYALLVALPASRWAMIVALRLFPPARQRGLGAFFHQGITTRRAIVTTICTLLIVLLAGQLAGLLSLIVVFVVTLVLGYSITRSIGGLTGDTYGAIAEITEVAALLAMILVVRI
jgi:adenosylcobinamide-GDP ribazoletransferase